FQIGGLVCYEDVFPEISRAMVDNGANILAVITNDAWYGRSSAAYQHLAISVFRAVENRRWLVKAANSGISAVVDATGKIISKTDIFESGVIVSQAKH
ncbi:MAG: apolipoprotein N-acyltransferase, partial [Deltaproteobacteria bacterium]|nr:apolipoprotein N-acyltransferase [Deltaproteobacteria bacterium]